jgi:hypothetical protein
MSNNTRLNAGYGGDIIATDDVDGVKHQYVKVEYGAENEATPVSANNPLPVDLGAVVSPVNEPLQSNSLSILTRTVEFETMVGLGLFDGYEITTKFGRNPDVDSAGLPEDAWNGAGTYTGFPTGSPEELEIVLSDAGDIGGVVVFQYLATSASTAWQTATITTTGLSTMTGISAYRMHTARFEKASATAFNLGTVTIRHRTTTANVFCSMPIGTSQTYVAAYTIPAGNIGIIKRIFSRVFANTSGNIQGALWVRELNKSPRLRRPFSASNSDTFEEQPYGGLSLPGATDITIRITAASTNNLSIIGGFDIIIAPQ